MTGSSIVALIGVTVFSPFVRTEVPEAGGSLSLFAVGGSGWSRINSAPTTRMGTMNGHHFFFSLIRCQYIRLVQLQKNI